MMSIALLVLLVLAATASHLAVAAEVMVLDDGTFEHLTQASTGQTTGNWFVKFYAPWCGHCKKLVPIWDELAETVEAEHPDVGINVAKVDCTENKGLGGRFNIRGYPTLIYFAGRKMYRYSGAREVSELADFAAGGYLEAGEEEEVPPPPSRVDDIRKAVMNNDFLRVISEDFQHIVTMRKNAAAVLIAIGAIIGLVIGWALGGGGTKGGSSSGKNKNKKD